MPSFRSTTKLPVEPGPLSKLSEKQMNPDMRSDLLLALDEDLLKGGVILSEWCTFIVNDADTAYVAGAFLASILTAMSGIETYLRAEQPEPSRSRIIDLIEGSDLPIDLKEDLHLLRRYRNQWVHVKDPADDELLLAEPVRIERELERMAHLAARSLRRTIYSAQCV